MKPLRYVDAHIHLSDEEYAGKIDEIVSEAKEQKVVALISNSMDLKTSAKSVELAAKYGGVVYAALGIHPWNVNTLTEDVLLQTYEYILKQQQNKAVVAIGEVGLDYKYDKIWNKQLKVFDEMLKLAEKMDLPVIVHSRGTTVKIVEMLPSYRLKKVLLHWFSNPISVLTKAIDRGYYISEGPPTVYSNGIREVVRRVPLENLLTETDGPVRYFKSPFDGKMTSPTFIPTVINAIAEVKRMNVVEVAEQILRNSEKFFGLRLSSEDESA
ncbi:MAG: TatD family hydrolase [Candidatus Bathyarchaeota archaeon]|nr:TatD family hydrolase [Candidatus Bathyarchaeota archaeon]MDW8040264.1 TatD family hydrolase [Nitrososphaerota archaeon]